MSSEKEVRVCSSYICKNNTQPTFITMQLPITAIVALEAREWCHKSVMS